jgi:hypothetical protein
MASNKYHISPRTGLPNICRATSRGCPLGGADTHFDSKVEAKAYAETKLSKEHGITSLSKSGTAKPKLAPKRVAPESTPKASAPAEDLSSEAIALGKAKKPFDSLTPDQKATFVGMLPRDLDESDETELEYLVNDISNVPELGEGESKEFLKRYKRAKAVNSIESMQAAIYRYSSRLDHHFTNYPNTYRGRTGDFDELRPRIKIMTQRLNQITTNRELYDKYGKKNAANTLETAMTLPSFKEFASNIGKLFSRRKAREAS